MRPKIPCVLVLLTLTVVGAKLNGFVYTRPTSNTVEIQKSYIPFFEPNDNWNVRRNHGTPCPEGINYENKKAHETDLLSYLHTLSSNSCRYPLLPSVPQREDIADFLPHIPSLPLLFIFFTITRDLRVSRQHWSTALESDVVNNNKYSRGFFFFTYKFQVLARGLL